MRDGMFVKIAIVGPGLHPAMRIVSVRTADGSLADFEVSARAIDCGRVGIGWPVDYRASDCASLIEFGTQDGCLSGGPNFGCHRVWVPRSSLVRGEEMGSAADGGEGGGGAE